MENYFISINFLQVKNQEFEFIIYRKVYDGEKKDGQLTDLYRNRLPVNSDTEEWMDYWISFIPRDGFEEFTCKSNLNIKLTTKYLFYLLLEKTKRSLNNLEYIIQDDIQFKKRIYYILQIHNEGKETVWLEPYYLKAEQKWGFLLDFCFKKNQDIPFSKRIQKLSLSIDNNDKSNKNFYIDKYQKIKRFLLIYKNKLFPIQFGNKQEIDLYSSLYDCSSDTLDLKKYLFYDNQEKSSQFVGITNFGPYKNIDRETIYYFIFDEKNRDNARELLKALMGISYSTLFSGMEKVFKTPFNNQNIKSKILQNFDKESLLNIISDISINNNGKVVLPILVIPKDAGKYYLAKYLFTENGLPLQCVTLNLLQNKDSLKWSSSNIALQIFAKAGGIPWKVKPTNKNCLIIGIGQAHNINKLSKEIDKFFAYSILTDSSGLYIDLKVLGDSNNIKSYLEQLKKSLKYILKNYKDKFDKFIIHTPFKLKLFELDKIKEVFENCKNDTDFKDKDFVVIKVNTRNKFFGYFSKENSLVPYESTFLKLSSKEYLVWFEGLQYHNPNVYKRFSGPTHVEFYYSSKDLGEIEKKSYLQDILNLSGANWRGFNAKSLPISIYYCRLVARFLKEFQLLGYSNFDINNLKPWFL